MCQCSAWGFVFAVAAGNSRITTVVEAYIKQELLSCKLQVSTLLLEKLLLERAAGTVGTANSTPARQPLHGSLCS
jgi:hypothetical protein